MEKQLINLTSVFLRMNRFVLFLLIAFPLVFRFYSLTLGNFVFPPHLFKYIGDVCLLCWLFAIGHRANEKLVSQAIHLNLFRFFNWTVILVVVSYLLNLLFSTEVHTTSNGWDIYYVTPIFLGVISILAFIMTIFIAAKTLVSAELHKEAGVGEYFITVLLMIFVFIGIWFIQPRVQKL